MEQPVLRERVAEAEEQVFIIVRIDVRDSPMIPLDLDGRADTDTANPGRCRDTVSTFRLPPSLKLISRDPRPAADNSMDSPIPSRLNNSFEGSFMVGSR